VNDDAGFINPLPVAKAVQSGDDIVFAGSVPEQFNDPLSRLHQQTSNLVLATTLMIGLLSWGVLSTIASSAIYLISVPLFCLGWIWYAFKSRRSYALVLAQLQLGFASLIFAIFGVIYLLQGLAGSIWDLLLGGLMVYMTISTFRRMSLLSNHLFVAWYRGDNLPFDATSNLAAGEILAMCPHCSSVLAIQPELLSAKDKCPNCSGDLVTGSNLEEE
jgi:hypothetical protein